MVSLAEFWLAPAEFPLGVVFDQFPDATLALDRVVPTGDTVMPYFWVEGTGDADAVLAAFEGLVELRGVRLMEDLGEQALFRAEWNPEYMGIMAAISATEVMVVSATGASDGWTFELRAPSTRAFSAFQEHCEELAIPVELVRLNRLSETPDTQSSLTPAQREALLLAYREGYYDDPRTTDQAALAAALGISRQALAARLRRGYRNLIAATIDDGGDRR